jgi:hypothetical protein
MNALPPKRALQFLRWFCREDYLEEIEGDLTEIFKKRYEESPANAKRKFTWSVIKYFRPEFIKSFKSKYNANPVDMFRHNLLITYRNFKRFKSTSVINLIGLSTGLASALLIALWVNDELSIDKFHEKDSRLYQLMEHRIQDGEIGLSTWTSGLTAPTLEEEMPEVEHAVACFNLDRYTLSVDNNDIQATGQYVGEDFFKIFSFPIIQGDASQVLTDRSSIVISETLAKKLFNTTDVVGKTKNGSMKSNTR